MANVGFKNGAQSTLNAILATEANERSVENGTFYLTTDTHKLYMGGANGALDLITPITIVDFKSTTEEGYTEGATVLPPLITNENKAAQANQMYYIAEDNIFCIYLPGREGWTQINATLTENQIVDLIAPTIQNQLNNLDPMKYMGVLNDASTVTNYITTDEDWGLVYKAGVNFTLTNVFSVTGSDVSVKIGDLLISQRAANNSIEGNSGGTVWAVIPSGDDALTWGTF